MFWNSIEATCPPTPTLIKTRMFSSDHCENHGASSKIMEIHNRTFHGKVKKYTCDLCGHQVSFKNSLARHKKSVHEEVKFSCRLCNYQATSKESLAKHKRAVHEGVKYPCGQCNHQPSSNNKRRSGSTQKGSTWRS